MPKSFLTTELKTMANLTRRMAEQRFSFPDGGKNITAIQCMVVEYLYENRERDVFQRDLEGEFMIRRSTVTGILQGMERRGMICRQAVERDARLKKLILTDKGLAVHKHVAESLSQIEARALAGLSEEEILLFRRTLEKIKRNLLL